MEGRWNEAAEDCRTLKADDQNGLQCRGFTRGDGTPLFTLCVCAYVCVLVQGIADTAHTIYETAAREHENRGVTGAVGGVLRQIPPTVVKPLIVATEATSNVLGGMRNQIRPDVRQEESQKWRLGDN